MFFSSLFWHCRMQSSSRCACPLIACHIWIATYPLLWSAHKMGRPSSALRRHYYDTNQKYLGNKTHNALKCHGCISIVFSWIQDQDAAMVASGQQESSRSEFDLMQSSESVLLSYCILIQLRPWLTLPLQFTAINDESTHSIQGSTPKLTRHLVDCPNSSPEAHLEGQQWLKDHKAKILPPVPTHVSSLNPLPYSLPSQSLLVQPNTQLLLRPSGEPQPPSQHQFENLLL
jgi:hypothetical protein